MSSNDLVKPTFELSVVILCYRSGKDLLTFFEQLERELTGPIKQIEYVLVANYLEGSKDRTSEYALQIAKERPNCLVLRNAKKGMMGWDMRQGLQASTGNVICVIDGDGQFPVSSIMDCYNTLTDQNLDLVKTYRSSREDGIYRKTISGIYNTLFSIMFPGLKSKDINSKPKLMTRKAFEQMKLSSDDWFVDAEIMLNVRHLGLNYTEIPVQFNELKGRKSFVKPSAIFEFIKNMLVYRSR